MDAGILILVALFGLFWLLLIRPQRRRQRAQEQMIADLAVGDEIVTAGGLYGEVTGIDDDELRVEIAEGIEVRVARRAVAGVMSDQDEDEEDEDEADVDEIDEEPEAEPEPEAGPASEARGAR